MLSRKAHDTDGAYLPEEWTQKVADLMNHVYERECRERNRIFQAFGRIFADEILVIVSFANNADLGSLPITCFLSMDTLEESSDPKILDRLVDVSGMIYDAIFADPDWSDYDENWSEHEHKGLLFHYRLSRENVTMTLLADAMLLNDAKNNN